MTQTPIRKEYRRRLRLTRLLNAYLPLFLMRYLIKIGIRHVKIPDDITREEQDVEGVKCQWLLPDDYSEEKILLYLHGGGFILGLTSLHLEMIAYLTQKLGFRSLVVDYRIAPEYPFPAPLDDCITVYRWLLKNGYKAENIVIAGDSAGGNLAIASIMKLRDEGDTLPKAVACLSPVATLAKRDDTYKKIYDPVLHPRASKRYHRSYIGNNDPNNPYISPINGSFDNFPPLLLHAGEYEILQYDSIRLEQKARSSGVEVELQIFPGMWHVWQIYPTVPETKESLDKIISFLNRKMS